MNIKDLTTHEIKEKIIAFLKKENKNETINAFLKKKINNFYKLKTPNSKNFSYHIHDPFLIIGDDINLTSFYLIGDNWLDKKGNKPIALIVGFNDWKYGFTSEYLQEYRCIFAKR